MRITRGNPTIGFLDFGRLLDYNQGIPERRSASSGTIDGETVHQISAARESDREISIPAILTATKKVILESLHMASTTQGLIHLLQDGEDVWLGYIKGVPNKSIPNQGLYRYSFVFHCTEKMS